LKAIGATGGKRGQRRRRLRLLACAAFGPTRHLLRAEYGGRAIEIAERYADGIAEQSELQALRQKLRANPPVTGLPQRMAETIILGLLDAGSDLLVAQAALHDAPLALVHEAKAAKPMAFQRTLRKAQAPLVRDIFGNPFRLVTLHPGWRTPAVLGVAGAIYDERAFDRLPILADALEDAGCPDFDLLAHLRSPGPHVRGCRALDLVLAKE
jgi:hypothetical protein